MRPLVITGATGWIGRVLLSRVALASALDRVRLFGSDEGRIAVGPATLPVRPLASIVGADVADADIVHLAYLTQEKAGLLGHEPYAAINRAIDAALLRACADAPPHAVFVASSGAARDGESLYGQLKREQEAAFLALAPSGTPVLVARIFALAGPYMNKLSSYAVGDFLQQGMATRRIIVRADRPVFRSYLHVDDLARLALGAMERGIGCAAPVDFCGSEVLEMGEIARSAAATIGLAADAIERAPLVTYEPSAYIGDPAAMRALAMRLGVALRPFAAQVADTAEWLTLERF